MESFEEAYDPPRDCRIACWWIVAAVMRIVHMWFCDSKYNGGDNR